MSKEALSAAYQKIGEGFIALSRAMWDEKPSDTSTPPDVSGFKCPICGGPMRLRSARATGELFAGCRQYPSCKGTRNLAGVPGNTKPLSSSSDNAPDHDEDTPF